MKHHLTIEPALPPGQRHLLEDTLRALGYHVIGGGGFLDGSQCDISFETGSNPADGAEANGTL